MKGKDLIRFIQKNDLEDAIVIVTSTMYYQGDHDCITTDDVSINKSNYKDNTAINFYVDSSLY